jgi:hypothetical protein
VGTRWSNDGSGMIASARAHSSQKSPEGCFLKTLAGESLPGMAVELFHTAAQRDAARGHVRRTMGECKPNFLVNLS